MENSDITENSDPSLQLFFTDFIDEYEHYEETEDEYDHEEEDSYDDGIAKSFSDDSYDEAFDEDSEDPTPETDQSSNNSPSFIKELEDSLQESEDYDELDD